MKSFRKLLTAVLLVLTVTVMTACASENGSVDPATEQQLLNGAVAMFSSMIELSDEEIDTYIEQYEYEQNTVYANGFNSWKSSKEELGDFVSLKDYKTERTGKGGYKCTINAKFEKRDCEFVLATDRMMNELTELTFNAEYSLGEKLSQASVNLAVGMGTVFVVLIFLTWIISLFKYVNKAQQKMEAKKAEKTSGDAVENDTDGNAVFEPNNDEEIQAVIAAAIAAYESDDETFEAQGTLDNGINVKSYRR